MTDPQRNRAESGQAGGVAHDHPPVPPQSMRPEDGDAARPRAYAAEDSGAAGGIGGRGPAVARMAWTAALAAAVGMLAAGVLLLVWPQEIGRAHV